MSPKYSAQPTSGGVSAGPIAMCDGSPGATCQPRGASPQRAFSARIRRAEASAWCRGIVPSASAWRTAAAARNGCASQDIAQSAPARSARTVARTGLIPSDELADGTIPRDQADASARRILALKARWGLAPRG